MFSEFELIDIVILRHEDKVECLFVYTRHVHKSLDSSNEVEVTESTLRRQPGISLVIRVTVDSSAASDDRWQKDDASEVKSVKI